ncbi:MAG: enoyl-CoA hydratase-related protein [Chloroflexi bacterium]|nr:enoyl-CoA hydratase-related protein [Chloroflexota bacterium]
MSSGSVGLSVSDHVATLSFSIASDRELDEHVAADFREATISISEDDAVRVVVVAGLSDLSHTETPTPVRTLIKLADCVAGIPKPVIATIGGDAMNQALELALACDIRVASEASRFGFTYLTHGQLPSNGATQRLPRIIGQPRALEMLLTSRVLHASEAVRIGLVHEAHPERQVDERVRQLAKIIAELAPVAAQYLKEAILKGSDMTLEQGMRLEADLSILLQGTSDRAEGLMAFEKKREPGFTGN